MSGLPTLSWPSGKEITAVTSVTRVQLTVVEETIYNACLVNEIQ